MTVASDPRLEGERKPSKAKTVGKMRELRWVHQSRLYTKCDSDHGAQLGAIAHHDWQDKGVTWLSEYFTMNKLPSPVFLNILLQFDLSGSYDVKLLTWTLHWGQLRYSGISGGEGMGIVYTKKNHTTHISVHTPQQYHGHHDAKEYNDDEWID